MMKPLVSVVTPSWNQGKYIGECIGSVTSPEEGLVEHIIIDNCSDDETPDVLARNPHLRVEVGKDKGQSDGLNKGIALAQGEWILWLNADDYMLPGLLEKFIEVVRAKPALDVLYGHTVYVDEESKPWRTLFQTKWRYFMIQFGLMVMPTSGTLFRASLLRENPLDLDFHIIMDSEWFLRNGRGLKVERLQQRTMAFRVTDENKTSVSIRTGELVPRHAKERKVLGNRYPFYGKFGENQHGKFANWLLWLARRPIRMRIIADKALSKLLAR